MRHENFAFFTGKKQLVHCGIYHLMTETEKELQQLAVSKPWYDDLTLELVLPI